MTTETTKEDVNNYVNWAAGDFRKKYEEKCSLRDKLQKEYDIFFKNFGADKINADPQLKETSERIIKILRELDNDISVSQEID